MEDNNKTILYPILVLLGIFLVVSMIYCFLTYRSLAKTESTVNNDWEKISDKYDFRSAILGGLVGLAGGKIDKEGKVVEEIADSHRGWAENKYSEDIEARMVKAENLDKNIAKFSKLMETYPDLQASEEYLQYQDKLQKTKVEIDQFRVEYNDSVTEHNRQLKMFPEKYIAKLFRINSYPYFQKD